MFIDDATLEANSPSSWLVGVVKAMIRNPPWVEVWDLSGADLTDADLTDAKLNGADLVGAGLVGANLNSANLSGATPYRAILNGATSDSMTTWPTAGY